MRYPTLSADVRAFDAAASPSSDESARRAAALDVVRDAVRAEWGPDAIVNVFGSVACGTPAFVEKPRRRLEEARVKHVSHASGGDVERAFPEMFVEKLVKKGWSETKHTPLSVLNPEHPQFVGKKQQPP